MTEEQAREILSKKFSGKELEQHLTKIRLLSKGYWSGPDAKLYIEALEISESE